MKLTIRAATFETNSSSTHSLVMMNDAEYREWKSGNVIYSIDKDCFITVDEAIEYYKQYVHYDGNRWISNDSNWQCELLAESLNDEKIACAYYGEAYIEDSAERDGIHAVCFYAGNE